MPLSKRKEEKRRRFYSPFNNIHNTNKFKKNKNKDNKFNMKKKLVYLPKCKHAVTLYRLCPVVGYQKGQNPSKLATQCIVTVIR